MIKRSILWTSQPQYPAPLAGGLTPDFVIGNYGLQSAGKIQRTLTRGSGSNIQVRPDGFTSDGSGNGDLSFTAIGPGYNRPFLALYVFDAPIGGTDMGYLGGGTVNPVHGTGISFYYGRSVTFTNQTNMRGRHVVAIKGYFDSVWKVSCFHDAAPFSPEIKNTDFNEYNFNFDHVLGRGDGFNDFAGTLNLFAYWDNVNIPDQVVGQFVQNPNQIFQPQQRRILVASGGSTNYTLDLASGSFSLTGSSATLLANRVLTLASGSYTLIGSDISLALTRVLSLESGSFVTTGSDTTLLHNKFLNLDTGSFTLTGSSSTLLHNKVLDLSGASIALTGGNATLTYTPAGAYSLTLDAANFTVSGGNTSLLHNKLLALGSGSFSISGGDMSMLKAIMMRLDPGSFSLSGGTATFLRNYALPLSGGSFSVNGSTVTLDWSGAADLEIIEALQSYITTQKALGSNITLNINLKSKL